MLSLENANILSCLLSASVKFYVALLHRMLEGGDHACLAIFALIQFLGSSSIHYYPYVLVAEVVLNNLLGFVPTTLA